MKSAYHHIEIYPEHRTFLGFSHCTEGKTKNYVFNSLPFGVKTAGHIFTKVTRVVVEYLRERGHKVIMFLDDGLGGHENYDMTIDECQ